MFFEMKIRSAELKKETSVSVLLPNKAQPPYKTLWLLHGLSGNHTDWVRKSSIERYAAEHNLAVIMPDADRSWYTNTAYELNYFNYVAYELPDICRRVFNGLSDKREYNIVAGLSMGGYGALKLALACPESYCACASLSGSLDITRKGRPCNLSEWRSIFGFDIESPLELEGSEHDLFLLSSKNAAAGVSLPSLYLWCGTEDSLIRVNRDFDRHLTELGVEHKYEESEGDHSWKWWDLHIQSALAYFKSSSIIE